MLDKNYYLKDLEKQAELIDILHLGYKSKINSAISELMDDLVKGGDGSTAIEKINVLSEIYQAQLRIAKKGIEWDNKGIAELEKGGNGNV